MESGDVQRVERRARVAYELARVRRAASAFAPMLLLVAVAAVFGDRVRPALALGTSLFIVGVSLLWYGHDIRRAVLPGIAAGAVPLVLALCARHIPHGCTGDTCFTLCVPACAAGGLVAGGAIAALAIRTRHSAGFWIAASGITLLTGSMGCVCAGVRGVVALVAGFLVGSALVLAAGSRGRPRKESAPGA